MQFTIPSSHPCLPGHFPGRPLVPGVVVLERVLMAIEQQTGLPIAALHIPQVKFLAPLLPEEVATITLDGAQPRWRFDVTGEGGLLVRGQVVVVAPEAAA